MKKALIISNSSGLVTLFLKNDVEILKSKGYEIECACNTNYPDNNTNDFFAHYNIKVHHVDFPIRSLSIKDILKAYKTLRSIFKNTQYTVVHCHSTIVAVLGRQCAKKYRKQGTNVVYTSHGFPFYEGNTGKKAKIFYMIEKYYSKYTDSILTICEEDFENAKKMNCHKVYKMNGVGVNVDRFKYCTVDRNLYRKKLGINPDEKVVLSIGELNTNKNHKVVIEAISKIKNFEILYAICGREVTESGKKDELQQLADSLNVKVKFLGFRKDIPEICRCADVGALPSFKEGLGLSGIEMLASGILVVGSKRQGIKDYVIDDVTGYLANPEDSDSFAKAIEKAFGLRMKKDIVSQCQEMTEKFNVEQAYNTILAAYNTLGI